MALNRTYRFRIILALCAIVLSQSNILAQEVSFESIQPDWVALDFPELAQRAPSDIVDDLRRGDYDQARAKLIEAAQSVDDESTQQFFMHEAERIRRIQRDYSLDLDGLKRALDSRVEGWTEKELNQWLNEGRFDMRILQGVPRFLGASASNLYFRYPELRSRWLRSDYSAFGAARLKTAQYALNTSQADDETQGARRFHIRMTVSVEDGAVQPGETVRCWLPYPKETSFQRDVTFISSSHTSSIASNDAPHRSIYMEQTATEFPPVFEIEYAYTALPRYDAIDPDKVTNDLPADVSKFLKEKHPQIRFHQEFIQLADSIVGDETNPYQVAFKLYEWIGQYADYSFAREYSTLNDIPMYVLRNRYGDCGQLALLYMTLCRIKGIPARWESGWMIYPEGKNLHDWTSIYLSPYGWVPVDPNFGLEAWKNWGGLKQEERELLSRFYFGRLSPYRLVANDEFGEPHTPIKRFPRSDTVDFQRGELETDSENLYFNQFDYTLEILSDEPFMQE
ncbi:MAG: transglutaminase-like domain-containing protein [Candidatus Hinthialibacter antarcticus]|nr:transglutaminase-like domain-containing protein [Candidatus Hinthialibacter antarcticus]